MMGFIQSKATQGDPESIKTLATLHKMGLIEDEQEVAKERPLWELLDMCVAGSKQRKRDYWKQKNQMQ
ncbi:MAG: hypothetical protein Q7T91_00750 [Sulfuricurvum sp.]|nr:hypothetical protein [Sulfuricurvum sp.]